MHIGDCHIPVIGQVTHLDFDKSLTIKSRFQPHFEFLVSLEKTIGQDSGEDVVLTQIPAISF